MIYSAIYISWAMVGTVTPIGNCTGPEEEDRGPIIDNSFMNYC